MTEKKGSESKEKTTKPQVEKERLKDLDADERGADAVKGGRPVDRFSVKSCAGGGGGGGGLTV